MSFKNTDDLAALAGAAEKLLEARQDAVIIDAFAHQHARIDQAYAAYAAEVRRLDTMIEADAVDVLFSHQSNAEVVRFQIGTMSIEVPVKGRG